jgi:hypothetical protein
MHDNALARWVRILESGKDPGTRSAIIFLVDGSLIRKLTLFPSLLFGFCTPLDGEYGDTRCY